MQRMLPALLQEASRFRRLPSQATCPSNDLTRDAAVAKWERESSDCDREQKVIDVGPQCGAAASLGRDYDGPTGAKDVESDPVATHDGYIAEKGQSHLQRERLACDFARAQPIETLMHCISRMRRTG